MRQALAYAIDMEAIVDSLFEGKAEVAKSFTAPGDWLNPEIPVYEYNPEKAKELLKEAGWPADYTLDVVYYYDDQQTVDLMTIIGQYWQEVGVKDQIWPMQPLQPWQRVSSITALHPLHPTTPRFPSRMAWMR